MEILKTLRKLDFTEYEAKAYLALLSSEESLTGYAVAKNSGVPRSKIYETLETLTARGDIIVSPAEPPLYRALSVKELIAKHRQEAEKDLLNAERSLAEFEKVSKESDNIWNITGCDAICQKLSECIKGAKERILLEIWAEDFYAVDDDLKAAAERGVKIIIVTFGEITADYAEVYQNDMSEIITEEYGGRWIIFSVDNEQVIAGAVSHDESSRAAWTSHTGLVTPITETILHDLYIVEIMDEFRDIIEEQFGKNLVKLRQKYSLYRGDNI